MITDISILYDKIYSVISFNAILKLNFTYDVRDGRKYFINFGSRTIEISPSIYELVKKECMIRDDSQMRANGNIWFFMSDLKRIGTIHSRINKLKRVC